MYETNLPKHFLSISFFHTTYLISELCNHTIHNNTPYELLFKEPPSLIHLKSFGRLTYATTITCHRDKLDSRTTKGIFLGYPIGIKGYLLFDLNTRDTFILRNSVFYENTFPYTIPTQSHRYL